MTVQVLVESSYVLSVVWPHDSVNSQCMTWSKAGFPKPCFNKIFHISGMIWVSDKECCLKLVGNVCAIKWIARCKEICSACLLSARRLCSSFSTCRSYRKECDRRPMTQMFCAHSLQKSALIPLLQRILKALFPSFEIKLQLAIILPALTSLNPVQQWLKAPKCCSAACEGDGSAALAAQLFAQLAWLWRCWGMLLRTKMHSW